MAIDRFINFEDGKCPSFEQVRDVCVHYIGGSGTITSEPPRVFAEVPGVSHSPLARPERFIEVYVDDNNVDVMTREGDEFTNALAEGLASLIARKFEGKREFDRVFPDGYAVEMDSFARYRWQQRYNSRYPGGPMAAFDTMLAIAETYPEAVNDLVQLARNNEITVALRSDGKIWIASDEWAGSGDTLIDAIRNTRDQLAMSPFARWFPKNSA
jgi:hypothetical protein